MALRVLVVGHTYMVAMNRKKWEEMSRMFGAQVRIIVPEVWDDVLFTVKAEAAPPGGPVEVRPVKTIFAGNEPKYFYLAFGGWMRGFDPDMIHVEQGAEAFSYFQVLSLKRLFARRARAVFFTWMNLQRSLPFPFNVFRRYNFRFSDGAIAGNRDAQAILKSDGFMGPIGVIPQLGVDPDEFRRRDAVNLKRELGLRSFTIGYAGRLCEEKGVMLLFEAASRLAGEWSLLFLGKGPLWATLEQRAEERGLKDRIVFVDSVPHTEVVSYMNCMDVLVLPSVTTSTWKEQFGHVLIEAMACEVPVIGSSSGEIPNVIGDAGVICPEGDVEKLSLEISRLKEDTGLRAARGRKGRERVLGRYTHARIAEETYAFYQKLL